MHIWVKEFEINFSIQRQG